MHPQAPDRRLKKLLKEKNIRQVELAYALGVHYSQFNLYCNGWQTPPKELQDRIASCLQVQVDEIFSGGNGR
jgi:transcriptional regulator with XRE-family HTH domain